MAAQTGRDFTVSKGGDVIAGLRETGISVDNSPVNITSKDDGGSRKLAPFAGERTLDISASGVWDDDVVRAIALGPESGLLMTDITLDFADGGAVSGDFYLQSFEENGAHDGEVTYSTTMQSSEAWTYTAAT